VKFRDFSFSMTGKKGILGQLKKVIKEVVTKPDYWVIENGKRS
jgi:hypothetical protein